MCTVCSCLISDVCLIFESSHLFVPVCRCVFVTCQCLLEDPQPLVRSTATLGVCKILAKCWEVIPPTVIIDFLKKLVVELANDTTSPDVRCSVFKVSYHSIEYNKTLHILEHYGYVQNGTLFPV